MPLRKDDHEVHVEMERIKKWLKMYNKWNQVVNTDKLRRRVYKGIPDSLRGQLWMRLLSVEQTKKEQQGKYEVSSTGGKFQKWPLSWRHLFWGCWAGK